MPILVKCQCGHEITVADTQAGRKARCPECDAVLTVPPGSVRPPRGGAFGRVAREPQAGGAALTGLAMLFSLLGILAFFAIAGTGIFTGVTALKGPESFRGPFGLFEEVRPAAQANAPLVGVAFVVGGLVGGAIAFVALAGLGQLLRVFVSLDRTLREISDRLGRTP